MARVFYAKDTIFDAFVQELLNMPINLSLALYLVYPGYLFNMGPAYMFSRGAETLRIDGYLTLVLLTHGELTAFHRLMKYGEPLSMGKTHPSAETYSYKCTAIAGGVSLDAKSIGEDRRRQAKKGIPRPKKN